MEYFSTETKREKFMKYVPLIALCVALIALTFQVTVLFPWHEHLSHQFKQLARKI
jgi:hypothetical protein